MNTNQIILHILFLFLTLAVYSQDDSLITLQDEMYNRPFIRIGKTSTSLGGYMEGNTNYFSEDGVSDGFSAELRRFNIFLYSSVHSRIKFLSELEFEHGTEEISLETAQLDFQFHPALNFRAGIILPNIGMVNVNHDSPKWEFVERPLSSVQIIPTTLSEVGFGFHGKLFSGNAIFSYDAFLVNGLQENIILNEKGRTHLPSGKSKEMFEEDNNGLPMFNGKIALANPKAGEAGISYYGGVYNRFRTEGNLVEPKRMLSLFAFDFNTQIKKLKVFGEFALVNIDVPDDIQEIYSEKQYGTFLECSYPVLRRNMLGFENAALHINVRGERIDYNMGTFNFNGSKIYDEVTAVAFGIGFRPSASTVIRANYRHQWQQDVFGNPPSLLGGFQFGIASYF